MIKDRLLQYIIHPVFISLIIWAVSIFFIPPLFSKYRVKHIGEEYTYSKTSFSGNGCVGVLKKIK